MLNIILCLCRIHLNFAVEMISKTFLIISFLLVSLMLFSQCAFSISWVLSGSHLSQIENIDLTNKTSENNETDAEDDTEEKELIIIHSINSTSKLGSKNESNHIDEWTQFLYLDVKGIPPDLS